MVKSMTGYGKANGEFNGKTYSVEIKSLNSKNLDLNVRMPQQLRSAEMLWRKKLAEAIVRGKSEMNISIADGPESALLNVEKLKSYLRQLREIKTAMGLDENIDLMTAAMRIPDLYQTQETVNDSEIEFVSGLVKEAADKFVQFRTDEGVGLTADLRANIEGIQALLERVPQYETERIENIKTRLRTALEEKFENKQIDENRFEQELIFYIEKIDVSEEKQRLANHLVYFLDNLDNGSSQGKKLNFISQEIGREINTLGSKSYHVELQKIVVQMKDLLEKIKEQVLNSL